MKREKIAIVHYSYPPVIGGVEFIMQGHAKVLADHGFKVKIIVGRGSDEHPDIEVVQIKELLPGNEKVKRVERLLKSGKPDSSFERLKKTIRTALKKALSDARVCFIHNVMTMHFNIAFTAALNDIIDDLHGTVRFYSWCHDAALNDPNYDVPDRDRYPYSLLGAFNRNAGYIMISELRRRQLAKLFGVSERRLRVVPDALDVKSFLGVNDVIWEAALKLGLFETDLVMLFPSRILRRKNYELGVSITAALKKMKKKVKLLITGPPDPHNPRAVEYFRELLKLRKKLNVEREVVFLANPKGLGLGIGYEELKGLYACCDMLLLTRDSEFLLWRRQAARCRSPAPI